MKAVNRPCLHIGKDVVFEYLRRIISDVLQGEEEKTPYIMKEDNAGEQYQIAKADY